MKKIKETIQSSLILLPTPINISYWWNFGSLLGLYLTIQIISGLLLSMHYCPNTSYAFDSIIHIIQDVPGGWIMRNIHMNGASLFFICLYMHMSRNLYYNSFSLPYAWVSGISIFILSMTTAFLGYILPWGQMSFWGATVITNLVSTIPYTGNTLVEWIWGGFSINNATINRFFSFHFIFPFIITIFALIHLMFLHESGSTNPLGTNSDLSKIPFHPYFTSKDFLGFIIMLTILLITILQYPYSLSDPDNFTPANPLITPTHIQPEWYFLFAYAILRSIPNKLGGVLALSGSLMILYSLPLANPMHSQTSYTYTLNKLLIWTFTNNFILLTWSGAQLIEDPYMIISQTLTLTYFASLFLMFLSLSLAKKTKLSL